MTPEALNAIYLFISTFASVFCLGLQSQFVNNGHMISAFVNSLAIGATYLVFYKLMPNASAIEIAGYLTGGPFGIVSSMLFYRSDIVQRLKSNKSIFSTKE